MSKGILRVLALACALALAVPGVLHAQWYERVEEESTKPDTLAASDVLSAVDRLKAKVDSLRQALADSPERRRLSVARQVVTADSLIREYSFVSAVDLLRNALSAADSTMEGAVEEALLRARAGRRMAGSVSQVRVVARGRFSREDFYSLYPGADAGGDGRFYSASPDGHTLYFSSRDKSGAGGYDLYVSRRDRSSGGWSDPVNMGFPYSSPFDDILFADTPDGKYSVLVSGRDCPGDSLNIYALAYDPLPAKRAVSDTRELRALAELEPAGRYPAPAARRSGVDMSAYTSRTFAVRQLRDSLSAYNRELDNLRAGLGKVPENEQEGYVAAILVKELGLESLRSRLDAASRELQDIELDFLAGGMGQDRPLPQAQAADSLATRLTLLYDGEGAFIGLESRGTASRILPEGSFGDYIVYPAARSYTVRAYIPGDGELPRYAATVMRLYTGAVPEAEAVEDGTEYSAGPFADRSRAGSLRMALHATGVEEVYIIEN